MSKKVFVTGGNGFLGSYLIRTLLKEDYKITALKRPTSDLSLLGEATDKINWIEGDILDIDILHQVIQDTEIVFHAAAMVSFHPKEREQMYVVNRDGTANVVNACLQNPKCKLIHVSSIAALGRSDNPYLDETAEWEESKHNSHYAKSKYQAEMEVWRGISEGLKAAIVNPSVIIGAGFWNKGTAEFFKRVDSGQSFYPPGGTGYVDVRDVATCMVKIAEREIENTRFIINATNIPFRSFFDMTATAMKKKKPSIAAGKLLMGMAWRLEMSRAWLFNGKPLLTDEIARMTLLTFQYDNTKIKETLNFEFRPFDYTIKSIAAEYKKSKIAKQDFGVLGV